MSRSSYKRRKINIESLLKKINDELSFPFSKIDPLDEDGGRESTKSNKLCSKSQSIEKHCDKPTTFSNKSDRTTNVPKNNVEVEKLFNEIDAFCKISIPFKLDDGFETNEKIKKLNSNLVNNNKSILPSLPSPTTTKIIKPCDNNSVITLPTKSSSLSTNNKKSITIQNVIQNHPKNNAEFEEFFQSQIETFFKISVPFMLRGLDELDTIEDDDKCATNQKIVPANNAKPTVAVRTSRRLALKRKSTNEENINKSNHNSKVLPYSYLMFNLNRKDNRNVNPNEKDSKNTKEDCTKTQPKRSRRLCQKNLKVVETKVQKKDNVSEKSEMQKTTTKDIKIVPKPKIDLFTFNLKDRLNFCRNFNQQIKQTNIVNQIQKSKLDKTTNQQKRKSSKKTYSKSSDLDSIAPLTPLSSTTSSPFLEDFVESGYSSGSVPSPAISNSTENRTLSSIASSFDSSFYSNQNPNGDVIYLRSHLDYYMNKFAAKSSRRGNYGGRRGNSSRKQITSAAATEDKLIDNNQKVLEWRTKTLFDRNSVGNCPTPKHSCYGDTPPQSPNSIVDQQTNNLDNNNYLDLDCFQDVPNNNDNDDNELDQFLKNYENLTTNQQHYPDSDDFFIRDIFS